MAFQSTQSPPAFQKAYKVRGAGDASLEVSVPVPEPKDGQLLVRVVAVGLNPHDWKSLDMSPMPGATWGCDFSGEIVKIGSGLTKNFRVGDRVAGATPGNNWEDPTTGAFAEYVVAPCALVYKIPESMGFEEAATLGVGMLTIGLTLYHAMKLPLPHAPVEDPQYVLVYGGGTATGTLAIQALRLSGMIPLTTCSPSRFDQVKALGAKEAWDYHSPSCGSDIRAYTDDKLVYALDCITDTGSMKVCYAAISSGGGQYVALDQFPIRGHTRRNVKPDWVITWTLLGKPVHWKKPYRRDARPKDKAFGDKWIPMSQNLLDSGDIKTHPIEVSDDGLAGILIGVDRLRKGTTGGKKLIYRINQPLAV